MGYGLMRKPVSARSKTVTCYMGIVPKMNEATSLKMHLGYEVEQKGITGTFSVCVS